MNEAARPADPIRADVERALHQVVDVFLAVPQSIGRRVLRCASGGVELMMAPVRLARSVVDLSIDRVGRAGDGSLGSSSGPSPDEERVVAAVDLDETPDAEDAEDVAPSPSRQAQLDDAEAGALPIGEYESLAASHVVARLDGLTPDELRTVRTFEAANRGRRTVLGKIDQLLAGA